MRKIFEKMKFSNPGIFRISLDDAIAGGTSDARNSRIFNMFALIKVGERSGMGLCDIYNYWKEYGYEKPVITETINPDRITFTLNIEYEGNCSGNDGNYGANEGNRGVNHGANDGNDGNHDGNECNRDGNLSEMERCIFEAIKENNTLSAQKIADKLETSKSTVERATKKLKTLKYIERDGSTRGARIILK